MKILFKKVSEFEVLGARKVVYESDVEMKKFPNEDFSLQDELDAYVIKPEFSTFMPTAIRHIMISDAHTHNERLVFAAFPVPVRGGYSCFWNRVDGAMTFMILGGDEKTMKPDKVYLKRIAWANGYSGFDLVDSFEG